MNIVLIGYRGSGKTTAGKLLARKLGRAFFDSDTVIAERAGKTIKEIFETEGEKAFRDLEAAVIAELAGRDALVIATGGGALLREENRTALKKNGKVIYLAADAATLLARIAADPNTAAVRPSLTKGGIAGGSLEEIEKLLAVREPLYRGAADVVVESGRITPEDLAEQLIEII